MKQHDFGSDERGVSEVLGAVLVFGLVLAVLVIIQVSGVPNANAQIEFQHNERVHTDFQELSEDVLAAGALDTTQATTVESGVRYPVRLFLLNPGPAAGSVLTEAGGFTISNAVAVDTASEADDYWDGSDRAFDTRRVSYAIDYNVYAEQPETTYEYNTLYNRFDDGTVLAIDEGSLVDGNRITLFALDGDLTEAAVGTRTVELVPRSAPARTLLIEGSPGDQIVIQLRTDRTAAEWAELLAGESKVSVQPGPSGTVELVFDADETYELRLAKLQVSNRGTTDADEGPAYVVKAGSEAPTVPTSGRTFTVQVRDAFNNPVANAPVAFDSLDGDFPGVPGTVRTDGDGFASATFEPAITSGTATVTAGLDRNLDGVIDDSDSDTAGTVSFSGPIETDDLPPTVGDQINPNDPTGSLVLTDVDAVAQGNKFTGEYLLTFENTKGSVASITDARLNFYYFARPGGPGDEFPESAVWVIDGQSTTTDLYTRGQLATLNEQVDVAPGSSVTVSLTFYEGDPGTSAVFDSANREDFFVLTAIVDGGSNVYFASVGDSQVSP